MATRMRLSTLLKVAAGVLLVAAMAAAAAIGWLLATAPAPRDVEGWSLGPAMPAGRGELATAVVHAAPCPQPPCHHSERLYVLGGFSGLAHVESRVDVFDPVRGRWQEGPPLPAPHHHLAAAGLGPSVYAGGGSATLAGFRRGASDFWRLDHGAVRWQHLEPMPEPRWGHRMVAHDGRLYVVGGHGPSAAVLIYTPGEGWRTGAPIPVPRDHLSVVVAAGRIWAIGGRAPHSLARVDIYDPAGDRWAHGPDLPAPTSGAADGVIDGVIVVSGGEAPELTGRVHDRHWMLDTRHAEPRWRPAPPPPLAVHGADGAAFQGGLAIAGGASRHGMLSPTAWSALLQRLDPGAVNR